MTAKLKRQRRIAHEAMAALFPRTEAKVTCGPVARGRERHLSKGMLRRLAMREPAEVLEHLQD